MFGFVYSYGGHAGSSSEKPDVGAVMVSDLDTVSGSWEEGWVVGGGACCSIMTVLKNHMIREYQRISPEQR